MATFNDFIQIELPKRPFVEVDGTSGQVLVRSNNPLAARETVFVNVTDLGIGGSGSGQYSLITTNKIPIINNRILLPSEPKGNILLNMMMTYQDYSGTSLVFEYDNITIVNESGNYYAKLNESTTITGTGVVSYLSQL